MRTNAEWLEAADNQVIERAVHTVLDRAPRLESARAGALYTAATDSRDTGAPTDEEGAPVKNYGFFRAGMRVGSAPIKAK